MNGSETAAVIRTHLDLPVVYLRAPVEAIPLARADATHPAGVLHKPIRHQDLQHTLARARREIPPAAPSRP